MIFTHFAFFSFFFGAGVQAVVTISNNYWSYPVEPSVWNYPK